MTQKIALRRLLARKEVESATRKSRSVIYAEISAGIFPPSVKTGTRHVAWIEDEVAAINEAAIAGYTKAQKAALIKRLVADRKRHAPEAA
jgi:prophage regulatory protein